MPRDRDSKFHITWVDCEQSFQSAHAPSRISSFSTNLTQRRSAPTTRNVFKKATICQLRQAACGKLHNDPPTKRVSGGPEACNNPVSCALVFCAPWRFTRQGISRQSPTGLHHMSCPVHAPFAKDLHCGKYNDFPCILSTTRALMHGE